MYLFMFSATVVLKGGFKKCIACLLVGAGSCGQLRFKAVSMDSNGFARQSVFRDLLVK